MCYDLRREAIDTDYFALHYRANPLPDLYALSNIHIQTESFYVPISSYETQDLCSKHVLVINTTAHVDVFTARGQA